MGDLDFSGLRSQVESATVLPEFATIQRRARWLRSRSRLALLATVLSTLGVVAPAGVAAQQARQDQRRAVLEIGPQPDATPVQVTPSGPVRITVRAAAGVDLDHVWAAVDVCLPAGCNLQLSQAAERGGRPSSPARVGLLRQRPSDRLSDLSMTAFGPGTVVLSAELPGWGVQYSTLDQGSGAELGADTRPGPTARPADRVVQRTRYGALQVADPRSGRTAGLANQPPLREATVFAGVTPGRGVWVSGTAGGVPAVSVSQDGGRTWRTRTFPPGGTADQPPVLVTADGRLAYLFTFTGGRVSEWRSTDAGATWNPVRTRMPWPVGTMGSFGAVVRPDGSLLVWRDGDPAPVFLESTDRGASYHDTAGPGDAVAQVPGGYVALGDRLGVSRDARNWAWSSISYLVIGG